MFLLVSGRHVGTHPDGYQHGVFIEISIFHLISISCEAALFYPDRSVLIILELAYFAGKNI